MLELNAVHAHYGKVHVLQGTSLSVHDGEAVGLLGRNGVGKTTTLKAIMGLVPATGGEVVFNGIDLTKIPPDRFPRLKERLTQAGGTLSGGEQQMLAIARCLVLQPKLLILDEPTEGIMPLLVQDIRREIKAVNETGVSILLVEQNIKTALRLCSRIYIMEKGAIVHSATADELKDDKETLHRYLGVTV